jgi:hypothetical protein
MNEKWKMKFFWWLIFKKIEWISSIDCELGDDEWISSIMHDN